MATSWTLMVARDDLARTTLLDVPEPEVGEGEALLRIDRVGLTANNVTYAVLGEAFRYWEFFPTEAGWGLVPLWGFADVVASKVEGIEIGARYYGYLPAASHLRVWPTRVDARGFRDAAHHRVGLPSPYNTYTLTTGDAAYEQQREDLQVLYRPLFFTSFMLADHVADEKFFGARVVVLSSASSKTAYGTAFLLQGAGIEVVGLTSPRNAGFTKSLGCYDRTLPYDQASELSPTTPTVYLDLAGSGDLRGTLQRHLGKYLVHQLMVGVTHQDGAPLGTLSGDRATVFFAPDHMRKRTGDWGRAGLDKRFGIAWRRFAPAAEGWVDVVRQHGPEALREVWLDVLAGQVPPRVGHVVTL